MLCCKEFCTGVTGSSFFFPKDWACEVPGLQSQMWLGAAAPVDGELHRWLCRATKEMWLKQLG